MKAYLINIEHDTQHLFSWVAVYCDKCDLVELTGFSQRHLAVHTCALEQESSVYPSIVNDPGTLFKTTDQLHWAPISRDALESLKSDPHAAPSEERLTVPGLSESDIYGLAKHLQSANAEDQALIQSEYQERYSPEICEKINELNDLPWYL